MSNEGREGGGERSLGTETQNRADDQNNNTACLWFSPNFPSTPSSAHHSAPEFAASSLLWHPTLYKLDIFTVFKVFTSINFQTIQPLTATRTNLRRQSSRTSLRKVSSFLKDVNQGTWKPHTSLPPSRTYLTISRSFVGFQEACKAANCKAGRRNPSKSHPLLSSKAGTLQLEAKKKKKAGSASCSCAVAKLHRVHCSRAVEATQGGRRLACPFRHPGVALIINQPSSYKWEPSAFDK